MWSKGMALRRLWVAAALLCLGATAVVAQVQVPPGKWWRNDPELIRALSLTPQQVDRIEDIFEGYRERLLDLQHDLRKKALDLEHMLEANSLDEPRIESQVTAVEQARAELAKQRLMMIVKIRGQLKPEQWHVLRDRYAERPQPPPRRVRPPGRMRGPGF